MLPKNKLLDLYFCNTRADFEITFQLSKLNISWITLIVQSLIAKSSILFN